MVLACIEITYGESYIAIVFINLAKDGYLVVNFLLEWVHKRLTLLLVLSK